MSLSLNAMTTLANAQLIAGVASGTDTALFELFIERVSVRVIQAVKHNLHRATYDIYFAYNNRQYLVLPEYPIQTLTFVKDAGIALTLTADYTMDACEALAGMIYRAHGWQGGYYVSGLTSDPVAGMRNLEVSWTAGYFFPGDTAYDPGPPIVPGYLVGAVDSLPLDLQGLVDEIVSVQYFKKKRQAQGLKSMSEGGISMTYDALDDCGFTLEQQRTLDKYTRKIIA